MADKTEFVELNSPDLLYWNHSGIRGSGICAPKGHHSLLPPIRRDANGIQGFFSGLNLKGEDHSLGHHTLQQVPGEASTWNSG